MFSAEIDRLADRLAQHPLWEQFSTTQSTTYVPSKFSVDVKDDSAIMSLAVLGHDPKNIEINCYEDKIEIKAKKPQDDDSTHNQLVSDIEERITIGKNYDGRQAKAEVKNGILTITLEKKEESKPKKLTLKVG